MNLSRMTCSVSNTRTFLTVSSLVEVGAGVALLCLPSESSVLLAGEPLANEAALTIARIAGAALLTLGVACWTARNETPNSSAKGMTRAMLFYDVAAAGVLAQAGMTGAGHGVLLWPGVTLHSVMTLWGILCLRQVR